MEEYDSLDIKVESDELSVEEQIRMKEIYAEMHNLWLKEEVKAKQRFRDRDIKEGDMNTAYFHTVANQIRRKMMVHSLDGPDGVFTDTPKMLEVDSSYYKDLFFKETSTCFSLQDDFFSPEEKITNEHNVGLEAPFSEEVIKNAVFSSYTDGSPGPNGFPLFFCQHFWDLVESAVFSMIRDFHEGKIRYLQDKFCCTYPDP
jgi:hypothetical protein